MIKGPSDFASIKEKFERGFTYSYDRHTKKEYDEDKGLATNQARRFQFEATGKDATTEEAYAAQVELLEQYAKQHAQSTQDDEFVTIYQNAREFGLTDEEAFEQAKEFMANKQHRLNT